MNRQIITVSAKGGVGKSAAAVQLASLYRARKLPAVLVDGDDRVAALLQAFGDRKSGKLAETQSPDTGVIRFAMHGEVADRDTLINLLDKGYERILVDTPSGADSKFVGMQSDLSFFDAALDMGYRTTLVFLVTAEVATIATVRDMVRMLEDRADYVVVKNLGISQLAAFDTWEQSNARKLLQQHKGVEIWMPELHGPTFDAARKLGPFSASWTYGGLQTADKMRLSAWCRKFDVELEQAKEVLAL